MPQLNFKEIAQANIASGQQDTFEMFAREVLELLGYKVLSGPDRGSDQGRDLIVLETRTGIGGKTDIKWLVSCKHKAHSGQSIGLGDEQDILDRIQAHNCAGFIGFYSTLPASSLTQKLASIQANNPWFEFQTFDREKIERILLETGLGQGIAQRYLPESYSKWSKENFDINLAMARIGMPQPITYKLPNEDKKLSLEEVMKLYPQGNQYMWDPFSPRSFILCNNILGITKLVQDGELIDPPSDYFERRLERINQELENARQERLKRTGELISSSETSSKKKTKKASRQQIAKESRKRNRK